MSHTTNVITTLQEHNVYIRNILNVHSNVYTQYAIQHTCTKTCTMVKLRILRNAYCSMHLYGLSLAHTLALYTKQWVPALVSGQTPPFEFPHALR